jgi:hypothetical protein
MAFRIQGPDEILLLRSRATTICDLRNLWSPQSRYGQNDCNQLGGNPLVSREFEEKKAARGNAEISCGPDWKCKLCTEIEH